MPIALVKVTHQAIKDRVGVLDYISSIKVITIDKNHEQSEREYYFPSLIDSTCERQAYDVETDFTANKLINDVSSRVYLDLRRSSMIFVRTKREKKILFEINPDIPIYLIE